MNKAEKEMIKVLKNEESMRRLQKAKRDAANTSASAHTQSAYGRVTNGHLGLIARADEEVRKTVGTFGKAFR